MKRILSLLLILSFLLTALLACGDDGETEDTTAAATTAADSGPTEEALTKDVTDRYGQYELVSAITDECGPFDGTELVILVRDDAKIMQEFGKKDDSKKDDDGIDEAVDTRNKLVAERLGITVRQDWKASSDSGDCKSTFATLIRDDVINGDHAYDIAANFGYYACQKDVRENSANLLDKDQLPWLNFKLPCWNQSVVNGSTINGKSYVCAGDLTLSLFDSSMIFWQNVDLYNQLKEDDDPENMSKYVLEGKWVAKDLYKWSNVYVDSNSANDCDTYGVSLSGGAWCTCPNDALPFAWELNLMTTNPDGTHAYNLADNDKAEQAAKYFADLWDNKGNSFLHTGDGGATISGTCVSTKGDFNEGRIVFSGGVLRWDEAASIALRSVDFEYALIPWPKWDKKQSKYYTTSQDYYTLLTVLDHWNNASLPMKGEEVSAYLQLSTEMSYTDVRGFYFKEVVESKILGTGSSAEDSQKIFDQIVTDLSFDFWALYSNAMGDVMHIFRYAVRDGVTVASRYESKKATVDEQLATVEAWFFTDEAPAE